MVVVVVVVEVVLVVVLVVLVVELATVSPATGSVAGLDPAVRTDDEDAPSGGSAATSNQSVTPRASIENMAKRRRSDIDPP